MHLQESQRGDSIDPIPREQLEAMCEHLPKGGDVIAGGYRPGLRSSIVCIESLATV